MTRRWPKSSLHFDEEAVIDESKYRIILLSFDDFFLVSTIPIKSEIKGHRVTYTKHDQTSNPFIAKTLKDQLLMDSIPFVEKYRKSEPSYFKESSEMFTVLEGHFYTMKNR